MRKRDGKEVGITEGYSQRASQSVVSHLRRRLRDRTAPKRTGPDRCWLNEDRSGGREGGEGGHTASQLSSVGPGSPMVGSPNCIAATHPPSCPGQRIATDEQRTSGADCAEVAAWGTSGLIRRSRKRMVETSKKAVTVWILAVDFYQTEVLGMQCGSRRRRNQDD